MSLARTLRLDGKPDDDSYNQDGKVSNKKNIVIDEKKKK